MEEGMVEVYFTGILAIATVWLIIHTIRYYKGKRRWLKYMKRYAKEGDAQAAFEVGEEYRKGDVVKKDCQQALFWYHTSALKGHESSRRYMEEYKKSKKKRC